MPRAGEENSESRRNTRRASSPYNQSGRKAKMTSIRSWSPSLWNTLTFWRSGSASHNVEEEEVEEEEPIDMDSSNVDHNVTMTSTGDDIDHDTLFMDHSNMSEENVFAQLTMHSPRHSASDTSPGQSPHTPYIAPLPPSSPLHQSGSSLQDPLTQVSHYIDQVIRPRGGECSNVEALGLSMLIQSSVNKSGSCDPTQLGTLADMNPFLLSTLNSVSTNSLSPLPVRPTFTSPDMDLTSLLNSSSNDLNSSPVPAFSNTSSPSTISPGRTLTRNPNGSIYYQGGGSARSRFRSPGFGTPARKKVAFSGNFGEGKGDRPKVNGVTEMPSPSDGKRRRVGEEKDSSISQASGSNVLNGVDISPRVGTFPTTGLRFSAPSPVSRFMASTPARPSPLRQSIRAESSSPSSSNGGSPQARLLNSSEEGRARASDRASEIMAGIINDATPKKDPVPDVRNPYQPDSRSPTKRSRKPPSNPPRPSPRPIRQTAGLPPTPQSPKKLNALETIQMTAPQAQTGSKRSHTDMPPHVAPSTTANGISRDGVIQAASRSEESLIIDDNDGDQQQPPVKKLKLDTSQLRKEEDNAEKASSTSPSLEIIDIDLDTAPTNNISQPTEVIELDDEADSQQIQFQSRSQRPQDTKRPVITATFKKGTPTTRFQSVPKEPSPLRQSFQPDTPPSPPQVSMPAGGTSFAKPTPTSAETSFAKPAPTSIPGSPLAPLISKSLSGPGTTPFSGFTTGSPLSFVPSQAPQPVPSTSRSAVTAETAPVPAATVADTDWLALAKKQVLEVAASSLPTFAFAFTTTVSLSEYASQRDDALAVPVTDLPKFDFTAKPVPPPAPEVKKELKGFDWAGAGLKPPVIKGWICKSCGIDNADVNATKCYVCDISKS